MTNNDGFDVKSGITQYNLMNASAEKYSAARHLDNGNPNLLNNRRKTTYQGDQDHQLIGQAPNAGQQFIQGVLGGVIQGVLNNNYNRTNYNARVPMQRSSKRMRSQNNFIQPSRTDRCSGNGMHAAQIDTPNPQSCN